MIEIAYIKRVLLLSLSCSMFQHSMGLADHGAYFILNAQDNLCIAGGPIIGREKVALLQHGIPISVNCTNGLDQQWVITGKDFTGGKTKFQLRSIYSKTLNKKLNATIRGESITYFPNLVQFLPVLRNKVRYYAIQEKLKCLESQGENHVLYQADCNFHSNPSQQWKFILANQIHAAGTICTSFWSCNQ